MIGKILGVLLSFSVAVQTTSITYVVVKYEKVIEYLTEVNNYLVKKLTVEPDKKPEKLPCIQTPCDSILYFEKGKIEGLKLCPKHKQKDCPKCDPCKIPDFHVTEYGFINNHKKLIIVANLGVDTIDVVEIHVKPVK